MKYLAAYCLLALSGAENITADQVKSVLSSVEAEIDESALKTVVESLSGKALNEVIAAGLSKVPTLGGGAGAAAPAAAAGGAAAPAAAEEKPKEEEEEEDFDMSGGGLFGDDDF